MNSTVLLELVWTPGFPGLSLCSISCYVAHQPLCFDRMFETIIVEHTLVFWNALRHKQYVFRRNLCVIYPSCIPSDIWEIRFCGLEDARSWPESCATAPRQTTPRIYREETEIRWKCSYLCVILAASTLDWCCRSSKKAAFGLEFFSSSFSSILSRRRTGCQSQWILIPSEISKSLYLLW